MGINPFLQLNLTGAQVADLVAELLDPRATVLSRHHPGLERELVPPDHVLIPGDLGAKARQLLGDLRTGGLDFCSRFGQPGTYEPENVQCD